MVETNPIGGEFTLSLPIQRASFLLPLSASSFGSCKQGWYFRCIGLDPLLLWKPFLNFREFPRDPSMKYPWDKPKDPSTIKNVTSSTHLQSQKTTTIKMLVTLYTH
ncbi:unnamed protein product [Brassica rapa subsp. trilocularis]